MGVSRNTNEIVGIAEDAFNENILMREIKDINESLESDEKTLPDFALNFMVFIATTWHTTGKIQFLVARYGRKTLTGSWLYEKVHDILFSLIFYGFIGVTLSGDGASENRSLFGMISTISAADILKEYWPEDKLKHQ